MSHTANETLTTTLGVYRTAPKSYLSLLARDTISSRQEFDRLVDTDRTVASIRAMRYSVHALPLELNPIVGAATHRGNRTGVANRARKLGDRLGVLSLAVLEVLVTGPKTATGVKPNRPSTQTTQRVGCGDARRCRPDC